MKLEYMKRNLPNIIPACIVFVLLAIIIIYAFVQIFSLKDDVARLTSHLASTTETLSRNTSTLEGNISDLRSQATGLSTSISNTQQNIDAVKTQVGGVEQTVGSISGTVGTLKKLSQTDPELLRKYSKVYFMNENYVPAHLLEVPKEYLYSSLRAERYLTESWPFLKVMLDAAKNQNVPIMIKSAYRSFGEQQSLKSSYSVIYGADTANSFSADQGYSEHQLGTTLDFITSGLGGQLDDKFDKTEAYKWLVANAYNFGFVTSYPKGNNYYVYEPWHWRFVGVKLSRYLHYRKINFYDLDQREIDTYLAETFD